MKLSGLVSVIIISLNLIGLRPASGQGVLPESARMREVPLPMVDRRVAEMAADRGTIAQGEAYGMLRRGGTSSGGYRSVMLYTPPVGDQVKGGPCVGFAVGYAAASILAYPKYGRWDAALRSPAYVYNQIFEDSCTAGSYITDALRLICEEGICSYRSMPYIVDGCYTQPAPWQRDEAFRNRFSHWGELWAHTDTLRWALSLGYPVVVSFRVTQSYLDMLGCSGKWHENGRPLHGKPKYHAVCVVGFDDALRMFKVQNSWGSSRGDKGFFWVSYDLVAQGVFLEAFMLYGMTPDPKITGPSSLCSEGTYTVSNLQPNDRPEWSVSEGIEIVGGQGTARVTVRRAGGFSDDGVVSVLVGGRKICTQRVQVGVPAPTLQLFEGLAACSPYNLCVGEEYRLVAYDPSGREVMPEFLPPDPEAYSRIRGEQEPAQPYRLPSPAGKEKRSGVPFSPWREGYFSYRCVYSDMECGTSAPAELKGSAYRCGRWPDEFQVHPNPAGSTVTLHLPLRETGVDGVLASPSARLTGRMVRIYSQHAELMYEGEITDGKQLDVRGWPRGAYTVMVDGRGVQTLVVE